MEKVLIVDDNRASRDLIRAILQPVRCGIIEASHGRQALDLIQHDRPDLVLLDVDMPGLNGLEVVRRIQEKPSLASLPVVAVTAFAMDGDRERCLAAALGRERLIYKHAGLPG